MGRRSVNRPWWAFDVSEVVWAVCALTFVHFVFGAPGLLGWVLLAPALMVGKLIGYLLRRRLS